MSDFNKLKREFIESLSGSFEDDPETLSEVLSWILVHELARNQKCYDQRKYDYIYEALHFISGYSRLQLHQEIVGFKNSKSFPPPYATFRDFMTERSEVILLEALDKVVLAKCDDQNFKDYLKEKVRAIITMNTQSPRVEVQFRPMEIEDYDPVYALWKTDPGIQLGIGDDEKGIRQYLKRNPTTSFIALQRSAVVAAVLAGHDGRRGFLSHLIVRSDLRNEGIGRELILLACKALRAQGIEMALGIVLKSNTAGRDFWVELGWNTAEYVEVISKKLNGGELCRSTGCS